MQEVGDNSIGIAGRGGDLKNLRRP